MVKCTMSVSRNFETEKPKFGYYLVFMLFMSIYGTFQVDAKNLKLQPLTAFNRFKLTKSRMSMPFFLLHLSSYVKV
jgi:hypothetical protein